jgi:DNA-binding MurR/RpiR family transcriptional regulator
MTDLRLTASTLPERPGHEGPAVLLRLHSDAPKLSRAERRLAAYILDNSDQILYMSVHQLAEACGVSVGTVVRFCQRLGYTGFAQFKLMLAADLFSPARTVMGEIDLDDDLRVAAEKVAAANTQAIADTMRVFDRALMQHAVVAVAKARRVELFAVGSSSVAAMDTKIKFLRIGLLVDACVDPHQQAFVASTMEPGDVAIAITHSGDTRDVIDALTVAKKARATIITITAHARSHAANLSDIVLLTGPMFMPLGSGTLRSTIAQLQVLDILFAGIVLRQSERSLQYLERTAEAVAPKQI